jgi:hypothetical protein
MVGKVSERVLLREGEYLSMTSILPPQCSPILTPLGGAS